MSKQRKVDRAVRDCAWLPLPVRDCAWLPLPVNLWTGGPDVGVTPHDCVRLALQC